MLNEQIVDGATVNYEMTFEKLLTRGNHPRSKPVLEKWYSLLSPEAREIVDTLIDGAYLHGKRDAAVELREIAKNLLK